MNINKLSHRKAVGGVGDGNVIVYPAVAYPFALKCKISEKPYRWEFYVAEWGHPHIYGWAKHCFRLPIYSVGSIILWWMDEYEIGKAMGGSNRR